MQLKKKSLLLLLLSCYFAHAQEKGTHFTQRLSWNQVLEKAKAENKFIFVDCFATWCGPCREMDRITYPEADVGKLLNASFLSLKLQCDTSKNDGIEERMQYADARRVVSGLQVTGYPTLLFFSPEGRLVHREVGFLAPEQFIGAAEKAITEAQTYTTLDEHYKKGERAAGILRPLLDMAWACKDTMTVALLMRGYLHDRLDQLPDPALCEKDDFKLLGRFSDYLSSADKVFSWFIGRREEIDSIVHKKDFALTVASNVIYREVLATAIKKAQADGYAPSWKTLEGQIAGRFGEKYAAKTVPKAKMNWYLYKQDWENYCAAAIERIDRGNFVHTLSDPNSISVLNNFAWGIFQHSNDKEKLKKALAWSDRVVAAANDSVTYPDGLHSGDFMDTKANLLYKLGRRNDAISVETAALGKTPKVADLREALQKMQENKQTW